MTLINLFLHANSPTRPGGGDEGYLIYVSTNTTTSLRRKDQIGRNYVEKFYIEGRRCRWYGTVKARYHADVSMVEPLSFESDCEMQEWKENAPASESITHCTHVHQTESSSLMQVPSDKG